MDSDIGLNIYDSYARLYDSQVPRFLSMDPLAEKYYSWSTYAYVMNNPMRYIDPTGMNTVKLNGEDIPRDVFSQWFERFKSALGFGDVKNDYSTPEAANKSEAHNKEQEDRREATLAGIHTVNETMLGFVPFAEAGYKAYWGKEITVGDFSLEVAGIIPAGKIIGKVAVKGADIWTKTKKLSASENALAHWQKHGKEFPEFKDVKQYVKGAKDFLHSSSGTLMKTKLNGDILKYNPKTNTFGVMNINGTPRTMFKPKRGIKYWQEQ